MAPTFMDNAANLFVAEHNYRNASNARVAELERYKFTSKEDIASMMPVWNALD